MVPFAGSGAHSVRPTEGRDFTASLTHPTPLERRLGSEAHLSACLDLDGTRSVKGAGLAQADSGLLSLPYEATRFAGSPRPRVHRVRRDDLWTSASLPRIPSAQVPSSRRNSLASRTCSLKATAMNRAASTEVTTQRGELSRQEQAACSSTSVCLACFADERTPQHADVRRAVQRSVVDSFDLESSRLSRSWVY